MAETYLKSGQAIAGDYAFKAYTATAQTMATGGNRLIQLDTEEYDYGGNFNTSTYIYTCPVGGIYIFVGSCRINNLEAGGVFRAIVWNETGGNAEAISEVANATGGDYDHIVSVTLVKYFAASTQISLRAYHDDTNSADTNPSQYNTFLSGALLYET